MFNPYHGVYRCKYTWCARLAQYKLLTSHTGDVAAEVKEDEIWERQYEDEINEDEIGLSITFPKGQNSLTVHLGVTDPSIPERTVNEPPTTEDIRESLARNDSQQNIGRIEVYTSPDCPSPWFTFGPASHVLSRVLSRACINQSQGWLAEYVLRHPACAEIPWVQNSEKKNPHQCHRRRVKGPA